MYKADGGDGALSGRDGGTNGLDSDEASSAQSHLDPLREALENYAQRNAEWYSNPWVQTGLGLVIIAEGDGLGGTTMGAGVAICSTGVGCPVGVIAIGFGFGTVIVHTVAGGIIIINAWNE